MDNKAARIWRQSSENLKWAKKNYKLKWTLLEYEDSQKVLNKSRVVGEKSTHTKRYENESEIWVEARRWWKYARTPEDEKMGCEEARSKRALMKIMGARWEQPPSSPYQTQNLMFRPKFTGFLHQHRPVGGKNHRRVSLGWFGGEYAATRRVTHVKPLLLSREKSYKLYESIWCSISGSKRTQWC